MPIGLAYLVVILIWTTTPLAIQWSGEADWFFGVAARLSLSAVIILPLIFFFKQGRFDLSFSALKVYAFAAIGLLGGMTPVYWAAQTMPSGWIALIWGMNPIVTGVLIYFILQTERLSLIKWLGIGLSLTGLVVLFAPNLDSLSSQELLLQGLVVALIGVFFHSLSTVLVKKTAHNLPPLHLVTGALWITSLIFLIINPKLLMDWPELSNRTSWAIGYLVIVGSVVGFALYYYVLKHLDALRLGMIPMITPIFAVTLGVLANNEQLSLAVVIGGFLILAGLLLFELDRFYRYFITKSTTEKSLT